MKNLLYTLLALNFICSHAHFARAAVHPPSGCDTLTTVEGKVYLVSDVEELWKEVRFNLCGDGSKRYTMPSERVVSIKKAKPSVVTIPNLPLPKPIAMPKPLTPKLPKPPIDTVRILAKDALGLGIVASVCGLTLILSPIGLIFGIIAINTALKGLKKCGQHPNQKKLRRRLRLALWLGWLGVLLPWAALFVLLSIRPMSGLDLSGLGNIGQGIRWSFW
jgi:hypothetical protein